jgi:hypothetical protein
MICPEEAAVFSFDGVQSQYLDVIICVVIGFQMRCLPSHGR